MLICLLNAGSDHEVVQRRLGQRLRQNDCQARKLNTDDAMDRSRWRKFRRSRQRLTDDQDRCEWVNVSSGTGSPGSPGQNPERRKTAVYVCVRVHVRVRVCAY